MALKQYLRFYKFYATTTENNVDSNRDYYCPVKFDEIPLPNARDRNDKVFVVFAGRGLVRGFSANQAPTSSLSMPNSLSFRAK